MKRLVASGVAVAGLAAAVVAPLAPRVVSASLCPQPSISEVDVQAPGSGQSVPQQHGPVNSAVTLKGSNFTAFGCSPSVAIGNLGISNPSVTNSVITFTLSQVADGRITVTLTDSANSSISDPNGLIYITDPTGGALTNQSPTTSQGGVQMQGSHYNFGLQAGWEQFTATYAWTAGSSTGQSCPGSPSSASAVSLADDSHLNVAIPSQYCEGAVTVTWSAPLSANNPSGSRMSATLPAANFDVAPRTSGIGGSSTAGGTATVSGSGFGGSRGSVTVNGTSAYVTSWNDTSVGFVVPSSASSGPVQLTRPLDGVTFSPGSLTVGATISGGPSPAKAAVGDTVTLSGAGFGQKSQQSAVTVNSTAATITSWSPTQITFTVPSGATTGPVAVSPNNGNSAPGTVNLQVIPRITGITPTHAAPGDVIEVDGTTFGTSQGTATIGGQPATVTLWGDTAVILQVPNLSPGSSTVTVSPPSNDSATAPFTVDAPPPPPTPTPGTSSSSSGNQSSSQSGSQSSSSTSKSASSASSTTSFIPPNPSGPVIAHGPVPFVHRTPPPGPVSLRFDSAANQADPGTTVAFTVTLRAFGKPIVGAPVDLLLVIVPGADATITPSHAVTDANGQVSGTIHLSKTAGDHIILARSGIYSDEIRVVGRGATVAVATGRTGTAAGPDTTPPLLAVRSPVLWALVTCLLLFGVGFGLNLVTSPAFAGAGAGAGVSGASVGARGFGGTLLGGVVMAGEAVRFVAGLGAVLVAHTVGTVRGARGRG